ncbi:MAG: SpoIIE family protein phosphatase [Pyrinomonadaceae bacterium]
MNIKNELLSKFPVFHTPVGSANSEEAIRRSRRGILLLDLVILGFTASVAYADSRVAEISLGYLYVLPVALSALVNRRALTVSLIVVCIFLHDYFGPAHTLVPRIFLNIFAFTGFSVIALIVGLLGREREALREVVRRQYEELSAEINLAVQVQQQLLPDSPPVIEGIEIAAGIKYAKKMGGDYYDFIELSGGNLGIAIADVSGKGMPAALLMPPVETALRINAKNDNELLETFSSINGIINEISDPARFVTLFYGKLNLKKRQLEYINAGHNPPLYFSRNKSRWLESSGFPPGMFPFAEYETQTIRLQKGDVFVFYTDGLTESENAEGIQFSKERVSKIVAENAEKTADEIFDCLQTSLTDYRGNDIYEDDLTLIVLKITR